MKQVLQNQALRILLLPYQKEPGSVLAKHTYLCPKDTLRQFLDAFGRTELTGHFFCVQEFDFS